MVKKNSKIRFDFQYFENQSVDFVIGLDEAGRGPLAGPLLVGLFVLNKNDKNFIDGIADSKKISFKKRSSIFKEICENAYYWDYIKISPGEIDKMNVYRATQFGMQKAINKVPKTIFKKSFVLTDAMTLEIPDYKYSKIIKGDNKSYSIGAASIIAKVIRDRIMIKYSKEYPEYDFKKNKGYGTKSHLKALKENGVTPIHRKTYNPVKNSIKNYQQKKLDL